MVYPESAPSSSKQKSAAFHDNKQSLQERLHTLLTRLSDTGEILKKWPETKTGEDSSIHTRTTGKLISSIQRTIDGIKLVEEKVNSVPLEDDKSEDDIANKLRQTAIPLDLMDMLDFAGGLNPDCFARGLIKESLRQMGNLQRRKASMKMLAVTIQNGMNEREKQLQILAALDEQLASTTKEDDDDSATEADLEAKVQNDDEAPIAGEESIKKRKRDDDDTEEPSAKR